MAQKKKFKWDLKKIVLAILLVAVIVGVATGRISLSQLLGIDVGTQQQATQSGEITTEAQTQTQPSLETVSSGEMVTLGPIRTFDASLTPSAELPTKTKADPAATTKQQTVEYKFRNKDRLDEHYEKHGIEMGFKNAEAYRKAASDIINSAGSEGVLSKYKSDGSGDRCFYVEATKEFVVLSNDGYIRTYYICSGIKYYNKQ
ncbi:MAG: hypothetical protein IJK77_06775 [Lachnospiraceae bacterium]|nr:hypothetical protein [Lachnospiraceae bacterium]